MKNKIKNLDLSKYSSGVITGVGICGAVVTMQEIVKKSPEEFEKELYESLKKKYEEE